MTATENNDKDIKSSRKLQWKSAVEAELQELLIQASDIQRQISTAKTSYKQRYFTKKINKIKPIVQQYVALLELLGNEDIDQPITEDSTDVATTELV